jgi:NADPH-dependent 2,4-dienoyl-CoA reductase/sulfur reductase-like enzyme
LGVDTLPDNVPHSGGGSGGGSCAATMGRPSPRTRGGGSHSGSGCIKRRSARLGRGSRGFVGRDGPSDGRNDSSDGYSAHTVVVIGAGIAGLAAMRHLQTLGCGVNVIVLEVSGSFSSAARTVPCCWCTQYVANARAMLLVHTVGTHGML